MKGIAARYSEASHAGEVLKFSSDFLENYKTTAMACDKISPANTEQESFKKSFHEKVTSYLQIMKNISKTTRKPYIEINNLLKNSQSEISAEKETSASSRDDKNRTIDNFIEAELAFIEQSAPRRKR
jgi:hypothetical protein